MGKLRWFLGEFFVVVAGVLVAFGLNGWYTSIQDARKEETYIVHVYHDLSSNIKLLEEAIGHQRGRVYAGSMLLKAAYTDSTPEPKFVYRNLFRFMQFSVGSSVSTTLNSLVNTGDLQLIEDDSLRIAFGEMVGLAATHADNMRDLTTFGLLPAYERLSQEVNISDLRFQVVQPEHLARMAEDSLQGVPYPDHLIDLPEHDLQAMLQSATFRHEATNFFIAQNNLYGQELEFEKALKKTHALVIRRMDQLHIDRLEEAEPSAPASAP